MAIENKTENIMIKNPHTEGTLCHSSWELRKACNELINLIAIELKLEEICNWLTNRMKKND